ncbi:MAG: Crp/Fnr family transcriptional regulator [Lactobacillus sp.]|nr:Crp/Fnr family transcriptional regulator [Lactobacillus sp.]
MHDPEKCLSKVEIFKTLPHEIKEKLVATSKHQQHYRAGSIIKSATEDGGLIVIDQGKAKVFSLDEDGNEVVLNILKMGEIEGEGELFGENKTNTWIEALEDTAVCSIDKNKFQKFLEDNPAVTLKLLNNFGEKIVQVQRHEMLKSAFNAKERIWEYLKDQSIETGSKIITLSLKKKDLAAYLGISAETFSRQLKILEKEGRLKVKGRKIELKEKSV